MARVMSIRKVDDAMAIRNAYDVFDPPVTKTVVRCLGDLANHESFMCFGIVWPFKMCCWLSETNDGLSLSLSLSSSICLSLCRFVRDVSSYSLSERHGRWALQAAHNSTHEHI